MKLDNFILGVDKVLRTLFVPAEAVRSVPGHDLEPSALSFRERNHAAALMRVNHAGEVCAQALYQGQLFMCKNALVRHALEKSSQEEIDHLAWTAQRIAELGGRKSILNPLLYFGSLSLGAFASRFGDAWNMGFLAETERQVESHLEHHLSALPVPDKKSRAIVLQMRADEIAHANVAVNLGAIEFPFVARKAMLAASGLMTRVVYYV